MIIIDLENAYAMIPITNVLWGLVLRSYLFFCYYWWTYGAYLVEPWVILLAKDILFVDERVYTIIS